MQPQLAQARVTVDERRMGSTVKKRATNCFNMYFSIEKSVHRRPQEHVAAGVIFVVNFLRTWVVLGQSRRAP